ncbi:MAG: CoB--CoM heterodisulfide reductase iron-sulfur subunit A family protein [Candidatus Helarchaeota archaeon]|nr:CoB--CoM heterodisulfide reductase iron-sulfur subunit A family protein [Candidatus Helarchaeota archaeon]
MNKNDNAVLIIGGGIAGIQASLDLAEMGIKVHLVEKDPCIGGRMAQLDKTFPTNDCAICILAPKLADCARHPNITLHTLSEVTNITGDVGNFEVTILKHARFVKEDECINCGECIAKCPKKVLDTFDMKLRNRKAIYLHYLQGVPSVMAIDKENCIYLTKGKCGMCQKVCPKGAINFEDTDKEFMLNIGAIIVATGYDPYDPSPLTQLGYGMIQNVVTSLEFERLLCASGPTKGHVERPSDENPPHKIAFIQCIGSRDIKNNPFCSSICCMYTTKEAMLAYEHDSSVKSYVFYIDMRAAGKGFRKYITRGNREYNISYIKSMVTEIEEDEEGNPVVFYEDMATGELKSMQVDLVVLATSLIPGKDSSELAKVINIELDEYNFLKTAPFAPLDTSRPGIFTCGCARGPMDIPNSVAEASGAAAKAAEILSISEAAVRAAEPVPGSGAVAKD